MTAILQTLEQSARPADTAAILTRAEANEIRAIFWSKFSTEATAAA